MPRFIFITGGVISSLGKGIAAASLGALLQDRGFKIRCRKLDPYLNVDAGTMSPFQHGGVFVTADGAETDLDLGHYERFTGVEATRADSITAGQVYQTVLANERAGTYLGSTVQVVPHVVDEIKRRITGNLNDEEIVLCELGGTVGDIEGLPFVEAIRQLGNELGRDQVLFVHLAPVPWVPTAKELKTKPVQHSVRALLGLGVQPDILLCRVDRSLPEEARAKIAMFCNMRTERVIEARDVDSVYDVPLSLESTGLVREVLNHFDLVDMIDDGESWFRKSRVFDNELHVAVVGKYVNHADAYKSLGEALRHAGWALGYDVVTYWIDAETVTGAADFDWTDAVIVPGGFGERGTEGMYTAITFCRENGMPFLGICFGMQLMVIESLRNVGGFTDADSTELNPKTKLPVFDLWYGNKKRALGGTMSVGGKRTLVRDTGIYELEAGETVVERYRHRYHLSGPRSKAVTRMEESGLSWDGVVLEPPTEGSCAMVSRPDHPFFKGVQFHPEFPSRPDKPHPLFVAFLKAALTRKQEITDGQV